MKTMSTAFSSSGKLVYAVTNHVAFFEKESVHADFHPLMDFLRSSPVSYALTASPTIYAEIVEEMWNTADCTTDGEIKFTIKGNSYILTPSVINEALHLPNSNFENIPNDEELVCMLKLINYDAKPWLLSQISRRFLRKEWSYFFDTLTRIFTGRCSGYNAITIFVQIIAYSLMFGRTIDIGSLLLSEFRIKLGDAVSRSSVVYYARFFMIIANFFCKELSIDDRDDTFPLCLQKKTLFAHLVSNNFCEEVEFVLPEHIQLQLLALSSAVSHTSSSLVPSTMEDVGEGHIFPARIAVPSESESGTVVTPSVSLTGKRKKTASLTINQVVNEEIQTAIEVYRPQKKEDASEPKRTRSFFVADQEMPSVEIRDGVPPVELPLSSKVEQLPLSSEEEQQNHGLLFLLEHAQEAEDRQHLVNAASVLKSQLVVQLTSNAHKLRTEDMIKLANKCYNTLEGLGDDYTSFCTEVNKLISQHQELEFSAKKKEKWSWNEQDIYVHNHQMQLSDVTKKLSRAEQQLSTAKASANSLRIKKDAMAGALLKLIEELDEADERVKILTEEKDQCKEAHLIAEAELAKLDAEKEKAHMAFKAINDQYDAANKEFERMSKHLLELVRK